MSKAIETLMFAMKTAEETRPKVGGFPHLAEALRQAGATRNIWSLPSCQCVFLTQQGPIVIQGEPLISGPADIPAFNEAALIKAIRIDQAGESTLPEFLNSAWQAGVVRYDVDFEARTVTYMGYDEEQKYVEAYPAVTLS